MTKYQDNLKNTTTKCIQMAHCGVNIEELVQKDEPEAIAELIKKGHAKEYYEKWKTHPHGSVRYALARLGLYPETFIKDKNISVRNAVVRCHPEYIEQLLARNNAQHWEHIYWLINTKTELKYIKAFLDAKVPDAVDKTKLKVVQILYALRTQTPTMLDKTMTPAQLFKLGRPFWATGLTPQRIEEVLKGQTNL